MKTSESIIPEERIEKLILLYRGQKVMLNKDLAELYGETTSRLMEAVKRQLRRFPADFMFQLSDQEVKALRSQIAISNVEVSENIDNFGSSPAIRGGRRRNPYVFTEQGVAMPSSVLNSQRAVDVNISIIRAFVRLRELIASHRDLDEKLQELESKYDDQFRIVFDAIRQLMTPPEQGKKGKIGFGR